MSNQRFEADSLRKLLKKRKIATMAELKDALGTNVDITVFRKLRELSYRTSYSHRGRYYTLGQIADFNEMGLWSFRAVWFSRYGTLLSTAESLVESSEAGYFADELEHILHVGVRDALRNLSQTSRVNREKAGGRFLYLSSDSSMRKEQLIARRVRDDQLLKQNVGSGLRVIPDELKAAIILFYSLLDEKQRRLYAGLESLKLGHGGDQRIADLLAVDPQTVAKGRCQLLQRDVEVGRVRGSGGGRKVVEKKRQK